MAVEPFTSVPGCGLERAVAAGTAPMLAAGSKVEAALAATFFEGTDVHSVLTDGHVTPERKTRQRRNDRGSDWTQELLAVLPTWYSAREAAILKPRRPRCRGGD